jgi:hypothetical protein
MPPTQRVAKIINAVLMLVRKSGQYSEVMRALPMEIPNSSMVMSMLNISPVSLMVPSVADPSLYKRFDRAHGRVRVRRGEQADPKPGNIRPG